MKKIIITGICIILAMPVSMSWAGENAEVLLQRCKEESTSDYNAAVNWCKKSAEQGNARAQSMLGNFYYDGNGVEKDNKKAVEWWRKAAEKDDADAEFYLGRAYLNGEGVPQSDNEAEHWFRKAADQGDEYAKGKLAKLEMKKAEKTPEFQQQREIEKEKEMALATGLPTCDSDGAIEGLKSVLQNKLVDWDKSTFCENKVREGMRQCIGRVTLTSGDARISFTFKKLKSNPDGFLTEVQMLYSSPQEAMMRAVANNDMRAMAELGACDGKK